MSETTWQYIVQDYSPQLVYSTSAGFAPFANLDPQWSNVCPYQVLPNGQYYNKAICDLGSTHTTNVTGASVSLNFFGQGVTFYGNVSNGMGFDVIVDGVTTTGAARDSRLASVSGLAQGNHTVILTAKSSGQSDALFTFDHALVTVGTGLTGANVRRITFQDSDQMFTYTPIPNSTTIPSYDDWHIPHDPYNSTWRIADTVTFSFSGNAILFYGGAYSWFNTCTNAFTVGGESTGFISLNSAMPKYITMDSGPNFRGNMYTSALIYSHTHLPTGNLLMFVDSNRDPGLNHLNLDYIEIVSVTGGSPFIPGSHSNRMSRPVMAAIIAGPIVGVILLLALGITLFKRRQRPKARYPLDLSDGYRASVLDFSLPTEVGGRPAIHYQPVPVLDGSSVSGTAPYPQHDPWSSTREMTTSSPSFQTGRAATTTDAASTSGVGEASAQEALELRRERDRLLQLVDAPPPEYVPPSRNVSRVVRTGKN